MWPAVRSDRGLRGRERGGGGDKEEGDIDNLPSLQRKNSDSPGARRSATSLPALQRHLHSPRWGGGGGGGGASQAQAGCTRLASDH